MFASLLNLLLLGYWLIPMVDWFLNCFGLGLGMLKSLISFVSGLWVWWTSRVVVTCGFVGLNNFGSYCAYVAMVVLVLRLPCLLLIVTENV